MSPQSAVTRPNPSLGDFGKHRTGGIRARGARPTRSDSPNSGNLSSDLRALLRLCPRPVLCVPAPQPGKSVPPRPVARVLLAYDASPKASEALLIAAYLAGWWDMRLTVLTVAEFARGAKSIERRARESLASRNVDADYVRRRGGVASTVLLVAQERAIDMLLMGGYGHGAALNLVLGSATIQVLNLRAAGPGLSVGVACKRADARCVRSASSTVVR